MHEAIERNPNLIQPIPPFEGFMSDDEKEQISATEFRNVYLLAEVEESGGVIYRKDLLNSIANSASVGEGTANIYVKAAIDDNLIDIDGSSKAHRIFLKEEGKELISKLKSIDPDDIESDAMRPNMLFKQESIPYKTAQLILENYNTRDDNGTRWLGLSRHNLPGEFDHARPSVDRALNDMRRKGYIEIEDNRIGLKKLGAKRFIQSQKAFEKKHNYNNKEESDVDYLLDMRLTIKELAASLGASSLPDFLDYGALELLEMSKKEIDELRDKAENTLAFLRKRYVDTSLPARDLDKAA